MSFYSIADLERFSGVRAHTIRIWEQRYNLLRPDRTSGNTRLYDDEDLRRFLNVCTLVKSGEKISAVSQLAEPEIGRRIDEITSGAGTADAQTTATINQLISAGLGYDEPMFDRAFSAAVLRHGIVEAYQAVLYPMLVKMGLLWGKSELLPAQEHFISNLVRQKIYHAIDQTYLPQKPVETWLLFLPEEEDHELGLLISNYMLRASNRKVIYLGQRVPYANMKAIVAQVKPDVMQYFIVSNQLQENLQEFVTRLDRDFREMRKYICGSAEKLGGLRLGIDHIHLPDLESLSAVLEAKHTKRKKQ